MLKLPNRRRSAGNPRRRRGRQSSHRATNDKLAKSRTTVRRTSWRVLTMHHSEFGSRHSLHEGGVSPSVNAAGTGAESSISPVVAIA